MSENQRTRITKQILKSSLIKILKTTPLHKISITAICEEAQINRTTFYKYYGSQYDLFNAIEDDVCKEIGSFLDQCSLATAPKIYTVGKNELAADTIPYLIKMFEFIHENAEICLLLLSQNTNPGFPSRLLDSLECMPQNFKAYLAALHGDAKAEYVFDFIINGCFSFIRKWLFSEPRMPPQDAAILLTLTLSNIDGAPPQLMEQSRQDI